MKQLVRNVRELKTPQKAGADVLPLSVSAVSTIGPQAILSNTAQSFRITITPSATSLTLWNFPFTVYVDTHDAAHAWPTGASLTSSQLSTRVTAQQDYLGYNLTTNQQVFIIRIENYDSGSHSYYVDFISVTPFV